MREVIREEIQRARGQGRSGKEWLNASEAAELYGLPKNWFEERGRNGEIKRTKARKYVLVQQAGYRDVSGAEEELTARNQPCYFM